MPITAPVHVVHRPSSHDDADLVGRLVDAGTPALVELVEPGVRRCQRAHRLVDRRLHPRVRVVGQRTTQPVRRVHLCQRLECRGGRRGVVVCRAATTVAPSAARRPSTMS